MYWSTGNPELDKKIQEEIDRIMSNYMWYTYGLGHNGSDGRIDCSALTRKIYEDLGMRDIKWVVNSQAESLRKQGGKEITDFDDCQVGDFIIFDIRV